jgi:toxin YoeB
MKVLWTTQAREEYDFWQQTDQQILERIHTLIENIKATPFAGIGKPEPLKHDFHGWWSRRITSEHRLVYRVTGTPPVLTIAQCRYHYE